MLRVLIVDDDERFRIRQADWVEREGCECRVVDSLAAARRELHEYEPDLVLLDLELGDGAGLDLLDPERPWDAEIVVVTGHASIETAVGALRGGVTDYLTKPLDRTRLQAVLAGVMRTRALKREIGSLRTELRSLGRFGPLIGASEAMQNVYDLVSRVAPTDAPVLVTGESGTGKELAAKAIHDASDRRDKPFEVVDCGGLPPTLIESELFGHVRGAFTNASSDHEGAFERADGGTLFLDELGELPLELQPKLLRALGEREIRRVGSRETRRIDVRVVAATNRDLRREVNAGTFRSDVFFRLAVIQVHMPPLRERVEDLPMLVRALLERISEDRRVDAHIEPDETLLASLSRHRWPGNVRELRNYLEQLVILRVPPDLPSDAGPTSRGGDGGYTDLTTLPLREAKKQLVERFERSYLERLLDETSGNVAEAARRAGVDRGTLFRSIRRHGIEVQR